MGFSIFRTQPSCVQVMASPEWDKISTRQEAVLSLWRTHNEVGYG